MKIIITENQLKSIILKEQSGEKKDFTLNGNVASQKLWDHIRKWESLRTFTYDDAVYPSKIFKGEEYKSDSHLRV